MSEIILLHPNAGIYDISSIRLPLNCLSLAATLEQSNYKVKIIDQRVEKDWKKKIEAALKSNPVCVGVTSMTGPQIKYALEMTDYVRKINKNVPIVWGGVHPSLLPEQTLKHKNADVVVVGEGDITIVELAEAFEKNGDLSNIRGIWHKKDNKIMRTNPEKPFIDLNTLPDVPYHLIDLPKYSELSFIGRERSLPVMTSRGCPYGCSFCYNTVFNKRRWRALKPEKVIERIKRIVDEFNIKTIYFPEDNFCADINRFREIVGGIIKEKLDIKWGAQGVRIDSLSKMDENLLLCLEKSGCKNLDVGIESGSQRILNLIDKGITVEQINSVNKKLSKFDFLVKYNFILGFPTETEEDIKASINLGTRLIKENEKGYMLFHVYTPFPGTKMYDLAVKSGFKAPKTLADWSNFNYLNWVLNYPSWHSKEKIKYLNNMAFISRLINKNIKYKFTNKYTGLLLDMYRPIAKFRFNNNFYSFFIEKKLVEAFEPWIIRLMVSGKGPEAQET